MTAAKMKCQYCGKQWICLAKGNTHCPYCDEKMKGIRDTVIMDRLQVPNGCLLVEAEEEVQ